MKTTIHHRGFSFRKILLAASNQMGFTLMEILVAILIVGILAVIAVPQYQRAVLKSRYASLMPIAKSMADSNEAYFLEHGVYADNAQDLPIQGRQNYPDGTELEFGTTSEYSYVLATRDNDFPNKYIVYQKHSEQFPGEIHCEAATDNTQAQEVCKSFGATEDIGETLTPNYLTYVLSGTGNGEPPSGDEGGNEEPEDLTCPPGSVCNSQGTVTSCSTGYYLKDNSCAAIGGCPISMLGQTTSQSNAKCTQVCADTNDPACYKWTNGNEYYTDGPHSRACSEYDADYGCAGASYSGQSSVCIAHFSNACADSTFTGRQAFCWSWQERGCEGSIFYPGANCQSEVPGGCDGALYAASPTTGAMGMCIPADGTCPDGVPVIASYSWNSTNETYRYSWKGGYCDPRAMATGQCPNGSPTGEDKTTAAGWNGGYCDEVVYGGYRNCPNNSPTSTAGKCWNGSGGTKAC